MKKEITIRLIDASSPFSISVFDYLIKDNCLHLKITDRHWKVFPLASILYYEIEF